MLPTPNGVANFLSHSVASPCRGNHVVALAVSQLSFRAYTHGQTIRRQNIRPCKRRGSNLPLKRDWMAFAAGRSFALAAGQSFALKVCPIAQALPALGIVR